MNQLNRRENTCFECRSDELIQLLFTEENREAFVCLLREQLKKRLKHFRNGFRVNTVERSVNSFLNVATYLLSNIFCFIQVDLINVEPLYKRETETAPRRNSS